MATNIGQVVVSLALESARFVAGARKTEQAQQRLNTRLARFERVAKRYARTFDRRVNQAIRPRNFLLLGGALAAAAKKNIEYADSIAKTARGLKLGAEQFQRYRQAAEVSGLSVEKFDKAAKGLIVRTGELSRTDSQLATTLRDLNPALLLTLQSVESTDEAFRASVSAIGSANTHFEASAIAAALFGSRVGPDMVRFANQGIGAIDAYGDRIQSMGGVISADLLPAAERMQDQFTEMERVLYAQTIKAFVANEEAIGKLADTITNKLPAAFETLIKSLQWFVDNGETLIRIFGALQGAKIGALVGKNPYAALAGGVFGALTPELFQAGQVAFGDSEENARKQQAAAAALTPSTAALFGVENTGQTALAATPAANPPRQAAPANTATELPFQLAGQIDQIKAALANIRPQAVSATDAVANLMAGLAGVAKERAAGLTADANKEALAAEQLAREKLAAFTEDAANKSFEGLDKQIILHRLNNQLIGQEGIERARTLALIEAENIRQSTGLTLGENAIAMLEEQFKVVTDLEEAGKKRTENTQMQNAAMERQTELARGLAVNPEQQELMDLQAISASPPEGVDINQEALNERMLELRETMNQLTFPETLKMGMEELVAGAGNLQQSFGTLVTDGIGGLTSGFSHAIANGQKLDDVFAGAVKSMIAGVIELGIQWILMHALNMKGSAAAATAQTAAIGTVATAQAGATAASVAQNTAAATTSAAAWTPAAIASSIGTFGGAIAFGAIALALISQFREGGMVRGRGSGTSDSIPAMLSNGEFVMPADVVAKHYRELEMMRQGHDPVMPFAMRDGGLAGISQGIDGEGEEGDFTPVTIQNNISLDGEPFLVSMNEASVGLHGRGIVRRRRSAA